jgi:hypothetical protein
LRRRLEDFALQIADSDAGWWPFLFLRPKKSSKLSTVRVALLAVLYGAMFGGLFNVLLAAGHEQLPFGSFYALPAKISAVLFLSFRLTVAVAWNRRAARVAIRSALR